MATSQPSPSIPCGSNNESSITGGVDRGVDISLVNDARDIFAKQPVFPAPAYQQIALQPFIGLLSDPAGKQLIDAWIANPKNLERTAARVGREPPSSLRGLLDSWSAIRTTQLSEPIRVKKGLRYIPTQQEMSANKKEEDTVAVLLSLDGKNLLHNVKLREGDDICYDGKAPVTFAGEEGAIALLFLLRM